MALPRFTLRQLDAFVAVAQEGSFASAAKRLSLTPSAVSQLVKELEVGVGFKLFDRSTRRVGLSSAGREFMASADSVLKHVRLAQATADDVQNSAAGVVRIAAPLVVACVLLPQAIKAYQAKRPKVRVHIHDTAVGQLMEAVASGDADLALGPDRPVGEAVHAEPMFVSPWVLWCSPAHPLARKRQVTWAQLKNHALVAAGRDHERNVAQMHSTLPSEERVTPMEIVDHISTALGMAAANLAATLSPAYVGAMAKPLGLVMRRIVDPEVMREISLYSSAFRNVSPAAQGFTVHLRDFFRVSKL